MSSGEEKPHWNMYDDVKTISTSLEVLMAEINSAITALEYTRATAFLQSQSASASKNVKPNGKLTSQYDARMADEAYKAGLASMAAGKLDEAVNTLNDALSKRPPDKTSAVTKLQSLISLTSQQLRKSPVDSVGTFKTP
ncbi:Intraflagellar transport [Olea europaea subsp. europaea]|uniref:Intraflagellar transport n=1 Tax=Olea europaea subsp. europaea TaxID=158383 RepID=A0A8S0SWM1_OLEEU|nr:Intraflagellar transport [Olea europaea subsp. europaea]